MDQTLKACQHNALHLVLTSRYKWKWNSAVFTWLWNKNANKKEMKMKFQSSLHINLEGWFVTSHWQDSSCNRISSSSACCVTGRSSSQPKLLGSFFQAVHILFHCPFNIGHFIVLCRVYSSNGSQQHSQDGRGAELGHHIAGQKALQKWRSQHRSSLQEGKMAWFSAHRSTEAGHTDG